MDRLLLIANDTVTGDEPWVSDGTPAGTRLVADTLPGTQGGLRQMTMQLPLRGPFATDHLFFAGRDPQFGLELWATNGSAQGTRRIADMASGLASSNPWEMVRIGSQMLCSAQAPGVGRELFAIDLRGHCAVAEVQGTGCPGTAGLVPRLQVTGFPTMGSTLTIGLQQARSQALMQWMVSAIPGELALGGGCTLYLGLPAIGLPASTDSQGAASLPIPVPLDVNLLGLAFAVQTVVADPQGAFGNALTFSNAVDGLIGR